MIQVNWIMKIIIYEYDYKGDNEDADDEASAWTTTTTQSNEDVNLNSWQGDSWQGTQNFKQFIQDWTLEKETSF